MEHCVKHNCGGDFTAPEMKEGRKHASRNPAYFPRAKHSSVTVDPLAAETLSGKLTSIFGSYSPITPMESRHENLLSLQLFTAYKQYGAAAQTAAKTNRGGLKRQTLSHRRTWLRRRRNAGSRVHLISLETIFICVFIVPSARRLTIIRKPAWADPNL